MLTTSVERLEGSAVKLSVTVTPDEVDAAIDRTYKVLGKKYRFPGFRPGKAPKPILEQQLGKQYILTEATEELVNSTYPKALDQEALRPIESPELTELDVVEPGKEFSYWAEIEVRPELTVSSIDGLTIAMPPREATQDEIDSHIEVARERFAALEPVEDRGIEPDDYVLLSFVGTVDGEAYEGNQVDQYLYEMGRGLMPLDFDSGLVGAKAGEERHIEFQIPEGTSEYAGKTAGFDVSVHEVKAKRLPEVDDEFAGNVGGFDSVDDMIADIRSRIDLQKSQSWERLKERRVREAVAERVEGDVPEAMITQREGTMMRDFLGMIESRGMQIDQYLEMSGVDMDTLQADLKLQAEQSLKEDLALEALFRAAGLEVSEEDVESELTTVAEATDASAEEARKRWEDLGLMPVLREQIMHRKATEWAFEHLTITEEAPESDATEAADEGTKKKSPKKATRTKKKAEESADEAAPADETTEE